MGRCASSVDSVGIGSRLRFWHLAALFVASIIATLGAIATPTAVGAQTAPLLIDAFAGAATPSPQFLYVYSQGIPSRYSGQYARYSLPKLALAETVPADGVGSNVAFSNGLPFFADTVPQTNFGIYGIPNALHAVKPIEVLYGLCSYMPNAFNTYNLATGPNGAFYVLQQCSDTVSEIYKGKKVASFSGGGFGLHINAPTSLVVDHQGNLYVGDNSGGVTFFRAGTTKPVVVLPGNCCNPVFQLVVDAKGDVWSTRAAAPTTYFDTGTCTIDQAHGYDKRNEVADHFRNGQLVGRLYSAPAGNVDSGSYATSIAVDSKQRAYVTASAGSNFTVVLDFNPQQTCPRLPLTLQFPQAGYNSYAPVAVDALDRLIVASIPTNTISIYPSGGSTKPMISIKQPAGLYNLSTIAIGGP